MRPAVSLSSVPHLSRRALGAWFSGGVAAIGLGGVAAPAVAARAVDRDLRDAALRGLALAGHRGDPVHAAAADAAMARLVEADPEGVLLCRLYRALDVRPSSFYRTDAPAAGAENLALLHEAMDGCRPVWFGYTDLSENETERAVLPLALVHPPQGVKLLAWCLEAEGYRQFFVRSMRELRVLDGGFADHRMALLQGLVEKEGA